MTSAPHRLRVAVPTGRDAEELGHLLFDYRAAVVLYLGGSRRHTATISQLEEASRKHAPAYPRVVRHIRAALGESYGRDFKTVTRRRNRYSVAVAKADPEKAVQYLSAALEPVRVAETSPLGNIAYNRLSHALADLLVKTGARSEATRVLAEGMRYLEGQGAPQPVLDSFRKRLPGAGRSASS